MKKNNNEEQKILKWRLSEKPTAQNLQDLVKSEIITKEEARQILLDEGEYNSKDIQDIKDEISLIRKLILADNSHTVVRIIEREYPVFRSSTQWITPYATYCNTALSGGVTGTLTSQTATTLNAVARLSN